MPNVLQPSLSNTPTAKRETSLPGITPYAEDLLKRGQAFTGAGVPVYGGQLTTGPSSYQNQAWQGLSNLTLPKNLTEAGTALGNISSQQQGLSYDPTKFTNAYTPAAGNYKQYDVQADTFGSDQALQYMNPYIEAALNPQLDLQQRRAAINQQADMAKLAQAGAFGGSRQAILQGLNQENLLREQAATAGAGYEKAYTNAQSQFNADQARKMDAIRLNISQAQKAADLGMSDAQLMAQYGMDAQKASELSKQFGAEYRRTGLSNAASAEQARAAVGANEAQYGLQNLAALSAAGAQQHDIEQAALDAQYKDWLRQTDYPGKQLEMQKGLISGLAPYMPKSELAYGEKESALQSVTGGVAGLTKLANDMGINSYSDLAKAFGTSVDTLKNIFGITAASSAGYADDEFSLAAEGGLAGMLHKMRGQK
jgi:hypothetical protein